MYLYDRRYFFFLYSRVYIYIYIDFFNKRHHDIPSIIERFFRSNFQAAEVVGNWTTSGKNTKGLVVDCTSCTTNTCCWSPKPKNRRRTFRRWWCRRSCNTINRSWRTSLPIGQCEFCFLYLKQYTIYICRISFEKRMFRFSFRKNALTELAAQWNPASEEFVQIGLRMESCTDIIQPCEEYNDYTKKSVKPLKVLNCKQIFFFFLWTFNHINGIYISSSNSSSRYVVNGIIKIFKE